VGSRRRLELISQSTAINHATTAAPIRTADRLQTDCVVLLPRLLLRTKQLVANTNDKRETTSVYTAHYAPRSTRSFTVKLNVSCAFTLCKCCSVRCETETSAHFLMMSVLIFFTSCHFFFYALYELSYGFYTLSYYHSHNIRTCAPLIRRWFYMMRARMDKHWKSRTLIPSLYTLYTWKWSQNIWHHVGLMFICDFFIHTYNYHVLGIIII